MTISHSPQNNKAPQSLIEFQKLFSTHLRAQKDEKLANIPARPTQIYRDLLFNNVCGFIDKCFPVTQKLIDKTHWLSLEKTFFEHWRCQSPIFSDIPYEFYEFVKQTHSTHNLADYIPELLHYEWVELAVELDPNSVTKPKASYDLAHKIIVNPTLQQLEYHWPVHLLGPDYIPERPIDTYLSVYRNHTHKVCFVELNSATSSMLAIIEKNGSNSILEVLQELAQTQPQLEESVVMHFGQQTIVDLVQRGALIVLPMSKG